MNIVGIIPARYASTRFPGKPLADIKGKTMIQRVYEQALKAERLSDVIVATDNELIFNTVNSFGGKVAMTSTEHRSGTDRCREVIEKLDGRYGAVVNIQGDEPFINPAQINQLADIISMDGTDIASLCKPVKDERELFNPNAVKVVFDKNHKALYFSRNTMPYMRNVEKSEWLASRTFYKHIGIYAYRSEVLKAVSRLPQSGLELAESLEQLRWLENGYSVRMGITEYESYSIDTPQDLENCLKFFDE